jgi:hypothetical protein
MIGQRERPEENSGQPMRNGLAQNSLTEEDRREIEERYSNSTTTLHWPHERSTLDLKTKPPCVSLEVLDEYYFLRDIVG